MAIDRRNPHKPFDPALIRDLLEGRSLFSVDLLESGKNNTNYKLVLSDREEWVLRLYSQGNAERETAIMNLVRSQVPVPRELGRGEGWMVYSFIKGQPLVAVPECSQVAAEALAKISSIPLKSPGWIQADGSILPFYFSDGKGFVHEMLEREEVRSWIGPKRISALRAIHQKEEDRLAEIGAECGLVHGDFNPTNILIDQGTVSGILDWEYAHSGSPYMDIGNLLRGTDPVYHARIKQGLEVGGMNLPEDWIERAELIDLSSHLEFLTSNRSNAFKRQCVARIDRFIEKFE